MKRNGRNDCSTEERGYVKGKGRMDRMGERCTDGKKGCKDVLLVGRQGGKEVREERGKRNEQDAMTMRISESPRD